MNVRCVQVAAFIDAGGGRWGAERTSEHVMDWHHHHPHTRANTDTRVSDTEVHPCHPASQQCRDSSEPTYSLHHQKHRLRRRRGWQEASKQAVRWIDSHKDERRGRQSGAALEYSAAMYSCFRVQSCW